MQWLTLAYLISLGTMNYQLISSNGMPVFTTPQNTIETTIAFELQAFDNHVFLGAGIQTWEMPSDHLSFYPMESLYVFSAGLRWGIFEIGYHHECDHPIVSGATYNGYRTSQSEFYFAIKGKFPVF